MFVDGRWTPSLSGETFTAESPATGEAIGEVPNAGREDAQIAIGAANRAADAWASATAFERADAMNRVADVIEGKRDELARTLTLDQGKPISEAHDEVEELVQYWRNAAEDGKRLEGRLPNSISPGKKVLLFRRPRGVIGVITPWNWPYTMPAELIAPALASGNTVVWTPASTTAIAAIALAQCVVEADLPPGVFNLVTGPGSVVGDEIARNPGTHGVGFIGSTETRRKVAEAAAGKAAVLELGGNGPVVVMEDADLDAAAEATVLDLVPDDSLVAREETFGPVAPVVAIESLEQAIELTNASPYGLLCAIFTRDLARGLRFAESVRTGWVNINESSNYWESHLPFGGRSGTASGIGRVGGTAPMESFTELQTVVLS